MVTLLLPTVARPELLKGALNSVVAQTAVGRLDRIIVAENGGDRSSEQVCREFSQLPITYIFRDPPLSPYEHGQVLFTKGLEGDITCVLHDDDWWLPHHLEDALAALEANPDAAAYGANYVFQENDVLTDWRCDLHPWFGAHFPPPTSNWSLSPSSVLLASFYGLVVHYSTLVARTRALAEASYIFNLENAFDTDRMLLVALSQHGPIIYNSTFSAGVRLHQNRETARFQSAEVCRRMTETTEWMMKLTKQAWPATAALFAQRIAQCPDAERKMYYLREATIRPWCLPAMAAHLNRAKDREFFTLYDQMRFKFAGVAPQRDR